MMIEEDLKSDLDAFLEENREMFKMEWFKTYYNFLKGLNKQFCFELFGRVRSIPLGRYKSMDFVEAAKEIDHDINDDGDLSLVRVSVDLSMKIDGVNKSTHTSEEFIVLPIHYSEVTIGYINSIKRDINFTWYDAGIFVNENLRFTAVQVSDCTLEAITKASRYYDEFEKAASASQDDIDEYMRDCDAVKDKIYSTLSEYIESMDNFKTGAMER